MLPLMLDVTQTPIAVIGNGFAAAQRLNTLRSSGAQNITTFATAPESRVSELSGGQLYDRLPAQKDFEATKFRIVYVCDIDEEATQKIVSWAHEIGAFTNVHDRQDQCDFHMPAILRRGHLQVTVSTDGKVAGLSRILRDFLGDKMFGPEWAKRVDDLGASRAEWVSQKLPFDDLKSRVEKYVKEKGWLKSL
ncbi:MAG: NAD(P)-dependent oxidoreductase [Rhodospirillaceae bacterium]|nr:NAD(P)-dependent oxidoreductase [Rhodospirillaceae bacterium]